ncbi:MAG TPA: TROVE domain-containing protein [Streptosporangiales bacterium]
MDPLTAVATRSTPQSERADARQKLNAACGYVFTVTDDAHIHRFLTIGTTGGTYYTSERDLTRDAAGVVLDAARQRGAWLVDRIVDVSVAGRAPRQNPALFALAAVAGLGDEDARARALAALPQVARTGTHLFLFARYVEQFRGWGRGLRGAVARWYVDRQVEDVAYQAVKYRQREGWSHRDLLRLAHPETDDEARRALFSWIVSGAASDATPGLVAAFQRAQEATDTATWVTLIEQHPLSWEMLPDPALTEPAVWRALITKGMPQTALLRQLPRLTRLGVLGDPPTRDLVTTQLADPARLQKGRVHPMNVLVAQRTYASGQSARGQSTWAPDRRVVDALDAAFYAAYAAVEPTGKDTLLALDVSGSMGWSASGLGLSAREASAALALVTMATEPGAEVDVVGFTTTLQPLPLSPRQRLDDAIRAVSNLPFGGTDCAQPLLWALAQRKSYDTFVVYTDNETWAGGTHVHQALRHYRERVNPAARMAVVGLTATDCSIADPSDPGMLDVAGLDSAVPGLIADFSRGAI